MRGLGFIITTLIMTIKLGAGHITGRLRVKMGRHHSSHQQTSTLPPPLAGVLLLLLVSLCRFHSLPGPQDMPVSGLPDRKS